MSANGSGSDKAVIRYMGYSIPLPSGSQTRKFSLTQSDEIQTVTAVISRAGLGKRNMGMVSFVVPTADLLVRSIEDGQDYTLSENGKTIFSDRWHDGLKARDALAQCVAQLGRASNGEVPCERPEHYTTAGAATFEYLTGPTDVGN
jgi:hypothetical protein